MLEGGLLGSVILFVLAFGSLCVFSCDATLCFYFIGSAENKSQCWNFNVMTLLVKLWFDHFRKKALNNVVTPPPDFVGTALGWGFCFVAGWGGFEDKGIC